MKIYVAGAPRGGGWYGSRYAQTIDIVFDNADSIFFPPPRLSGKPSDIYSEVADKIETSDGGVTFLSPRSSGPLIEAGMMAALQKPQAIIGGEKAFGSRLLRGLPHVIGFARLNYDDEVRTVLVKLKAHLSRR